MKNEAKAQAKLSDELKRKSDLSQLILNTANSLIVCLDANATITVFNRECERVTGYRREDVLGKRWPELFLPSDQRHPQLQSFSQWVRAHPHDRYEGSIVTKNGEIRTILWSNSAIFGSGEKDLIAIAIGHDITERKRGEEALLKSEEKYRILVEHSLQGIIITWDKPFSVAFANATAAKILGYTDEELRSLSRNKIVAMVYPEDRAIFSRRLRARLAGKWSPRSYQLRFIRKDCSVRWLETISARIEYNGKPAVQTVFMDITERKRSEEELSKSYAELEKRVKERTAELERVNEELRSEIAERKRAEEALRKSEERYALTTNAGQVGVWDWTLETNEIYIDPNLKAMLGYADHEIKNHLDDWGKLVHPDDAERVMTDAQAYLKGKTPRYEVAHRMLHRDGSTRWFLARGTAIRNENGKPYRVVGTDTDITEQKRAEREIERAHSDLNQILNAGVPLCVIGKDFTILRVNDTYCSHFHMKKEDIIGKKCCDLWYGPLCNTSDCAMKQILAGNEHYEYEWEEIHPKGSTSIFIVTAVPYRGPNGEIIGIIENYTDITERRRAEASLRKARNELETRVEERTAELARANEDLQIEVADRKRAEKTLRRRNRELSLLNHASRSLAASLDVDQVLATTLEQAASLLNVATCSIWQIEPGTHQPVCKQVSDHRDEMIRTWLLRRGEEIVTKVARSGKSLIVQDRGADDSLPKAQQKQQKHSGSAFRSALCVPLWVKQDVIGVLLVCDKAVDRFQREDMKLVESLAATAGIAIENARLYEQARKNAETKSMLLREVNHRVKNNLSVIIGLLFAEQRHVGMEDQFVYQSIVRELVNRVQGLATVHSLLSASEWAPLLLSELTTQIIRSSLQMLPGDKRVTVDVSPSPVRVTPDQAHHLALVINELATNTTKHVLRGRRSAHIAVHITLQGDTVFFEFRDDGPGYPEEVIRLRRHGVGFDLMQNIVRKNLHGQLSLRNEHGAVAMAQFKAEVK